ncbi:Protein of unknown function [Bacillus mycoides]|nr:Protein of unknown function [Bacillus mycoides]
MYTDSIES